MTHYVIYLHNLPTFFLQNIFNLSTNQPTNNQTHLPCNYHLSKLHSFTACSVKNPFLHSMFCTETQNLCAKSNGCSSSHLLATATTSTINPTIPRFPAIEELSATILI